MKVQLNNGDIIECSVQEYLELNGLLTVEVQPQIPEPVMSEKFKRKYVKSGKYKKTVKRSKSIKLWTRQEDERLLRLVKMEVRQEEIGTKLDRTLSAIRQRLQHLRLKKKAKA